MPLINNEELNTQATDAFTNQSFKNNQATNAFQQTNQNQKGLFQIPEKFLQLIP
jgi:hypothetical protein